MSDVEPTTSSPCRLLDDESATAAASLSSSSPPRGDADRQLQRDHVHDAPMTQHSEPIGRNAVAYPSQEAWLVRLAPSGLLAPLVGLVHRLVGSRPNSTEATREEWSNHQRQADTTTSGPAHHCSTDALHIVFSFLTLCDVSLAARTCRRWTAAAATMPSRPGAPFQLVNTREQLARMVNSTLVRHFTSMTTRCLLSDLVDGASVVHLPLCSRLPCLTRLRIEVSMDGYRRYHNDTDKTAEDTRLQLPETLRRLEVAFSSNDGDWHAVEEVLARLCHEGMTPIRELCITFCGGSRRGVDCQIPVSTLRRLLCLRESLVEFYINFGPIVAAFADEGNLHPATLPDSARWTQEHIDVFRQMTRIETLYPFVGRWSDEELTMLAAEPTPAHLHHLPLTSPPATDAGREALVRLPLTHMTLLVESSYISGRPLDLSFLGRMLSLSSLALLCPTRLRPADRESVLTALTHCTRLTVLDLFDIGLTDAYLCRLLPSLPKLRSLTLHPGHDEFGLTFASTVTHLASTLEVIVITNRAGLLMTIPVDQLHHLYALRNLRRMTLRVPLPLTTPEDTRKQTIGEFESDNPNFRRDRWPHMESSEMHAM